MIHILVILGILLVIILLVPFNFGFAGEWVHALRFQGEVGWAGGLLGFKMTYDEGRYNLVLAFLGLRKVMPQRERKTSREKKQSPTKGETKSGGGMWKFVNRQLFSAVKMTFSKLVRALHLNLKLFGRYGFDDPSLTGITAGLIAALGRSGSSIELNPDFSEEVVQIRGSAGGWFIPLHILAIGIVFLFKKPVRAVWWSKIKFRKKQKEAVQYA